MPNERLSDMTTADVMEYLQANPAEFYRIANNDPRVKLMETIHGAPGGDVDLEALVIKHKDRFPPGAKIPVDIKGKVTEAIAPTVESIAELRKELAEERKQQRLKGFHAEMIEAGAEAEDVEKIDAFMLDNDLGPKAVRTAVEKYYDSLPAEPSNTTPFTWDNPVGADQQVVEALTKASPDADLYQIAAPHFERVFNDMTKGQRTKVLAR